MTKRESSVEEGGSISQMLAVKGSKREELHDNYKDTEKKIVILWEVVFFSCAMKWSLQRVARWGRRGVGSWLWKKKKNQSMIKQRRGTDYWKRIGILAAT